MKKTTLFSLLATVLVASLATAARAGTILYATDFNSAAAGHTGNFAGSANYSDGAIIGQDSWAITGTSVVSPINVANTATDGNVTLATTGQDVNRIFSPAVTSGSVFMSADINVASANATGDYFIHLGDGTTTDFYARTYVKTSGNGYVMALGTSSGAPTAAQYGTTVLNFGTVYHMVAEYDYSAVAGTTNDTASLFINPTDPIYGGDNLYVAGVTTGTDASTISSVNLRQGSTGPVVTLDNIAVATVAVPEPASIAFCGLGMIGMIGFARRKLA